jgi:two-component system sensor histidine kinase/response regulator
VLINLIGNAIKFTERGEIELTVHCVQQTPADVVLAFAVRDSGIGISPTAQAHLFESFFQEDSSTTRRFGGSGLGLAICKRLVGLMQGRIWVDSTPGEGSTFHFTARFGRVPQLESATHHPRVSRHVLVVDDDRISRLLLVRLLHKMGHTTEEAGSGHEALARARRGRFDVLLLDWRMPDLDGLQVAAHLQANWPKTPHAPHLPAIVLVSGADEADVSQEARVAGIELAAYIAKPVTAEVLRQTFVRIFDQPLAEPQVNPVRERLRRGLRILLVEDNPLNQDVMRESLSAIAAEVTLAEHGQAALARLERQAFDLVLMDVQMPVMDGLDATRAIRARPEWAKLPIIGLTANALPGDREVCLAAGMNDYLPKPIEFDALLATIARWQPVVQSCPADHPDTHAGVPASGESPPSATVATAGRLGAAQRSSEDDLRAALQEIAELDSGPALERVRGQVTRYVEFLAQFLKQGSAVLDALEAAAAAGERTVVQRQAHSLKGSAGMIGARRLQAAAADLENLLRQDPQADFGLPLAAVRKAWQDLNAALRPILP